jgi:multiple sugar transport system permease protein
VSGTASTQSAPPGASPSRAAAGGERRRPRSRWRRLDPLPWLGPSVLLILGVIAFPAVEMFLTSFQRMDSLGVSHGSAGLDNYRHLLDEPALHSVVEHTLLWVVCVVGATVLLSLAVAQFLDKPFFGRRVVRWALIVPWAASLVMTSTVWRFIYEGSFGMLNRALGDLGLIDTPIDWYKDTRYAFWCLIVVGIIVSIPFTTYVFLAGLQTIPAEIYEATAIDGAGVWQRYRHVTLPLLRPALLVAVVLNTVYVFNSFPIIWVITGTAPGHDTDTTMTFLYKIAFREQLDTGEAAALSVLNVLVLIVVVFLYLRTVRWSDAPDAAVADRPGLMRRVLSPIGALFEALGDGLGRAIRPLGGAGRVVASAWQPLRSVVMPLVGLVLALFFLLPYVVMFLASVKDDNDLFKSPPDYLPSHWRWSNWHDVWNVIPLGTYIEVSLIIATVSTALVLLVSLPAAYYAARHEFRGRNLFLYLVLVTQMFAPVALVVGIYQEFVLVHGVNAYWAIILTDAAFNLAFAIWILNGYFASIPKEIEDAAQVDGLSRLRTLLRVILPIARPGVVTAVIFTFIQVWNEFIIALTMFNKPTRAPLTVGINQFVGLYKTEYQYLFVASLIAIVPVVALFVAIERQLVSGLTAGSVK